MPPVKLSSVEPFGRRLDALENKRSSDIDLLTRIDERTKRMAEDMTILRGDYVKKEEFDPVRKLVFGMVALVMVSVIGALLALVLNKP